MKNDFSKLDFSSIYHDVDKQQFSMMANGHVANIDYTKQGNKLFLTHSEVPYILRGKGIGKELVEKTFSYIEANNMEAVAVCSFIKILALRSPKWKEIIK